MSSYGAQPRASWVRMAIKITREQVMVAGLFLAVLAIRLFLTFRAHGFDYDAYYALRQAENIRHWVLVLPADHVIGPVEAFRETAARALARADAAGTLVTFGIAPIRPATGSSTSASTSGGGPAAGASAERAHSSAGRPAAGSGRRKAPSSPHCPN